MIWKAPIASSSGYGRVARNILREIDSDVYPSTQKQDLELPNELRPRIRETNYNELIINHTSINRATMIGEGKRISYHAWESKKYPEYFIKVLECMDEIWVPSNWVKMNLEKHSDDLPEVIVIPHFLSDGFKENDEEIELPSKFDDYFKFLTVSTIDARKNLANLLRSYFITFDEDDDVVLIVKSNINETSIKKIKHEVGGTADVFLVNKFFNDSDMAKLYNTADSYVMASRGEGFGLPYLEAMEKGIAPIGTVTGNEYMNTNNSFIIKSRNKRVQKRPNTHPLHYGMRWQEPDITDISIRLRKAINNDNLRKEKEEVAKRTAERFNKDDILDKINERLEKWRK